jgi:hypothetical protein
MLYSITNSTGTFIYLWCCVVSANFVPGFACNQVSVDLSFALLFCFLFGHLLILFCLFLFIPGSMVSPSGDVIQSCLGAGYLFGSRGHYVDLYSTGKCWEKSILQVKVSLQIVVL